MRGDGQHSFGHGEFCYWCGLRDDDPELEKPCDERETQKPSEEAMAAYHAREELGEQIVALAYEFGWGAIWWDEMMSRIQALRPTTKEGNGRS
jgi:hypothetical protein